LGITGDNERAKLNGLRLLERLHESRMEMIEELPARLAQICAQTSSEPDCESLEGPKASLIEGPPQIHPQERPRVSRSPFRITAESRRKK